MTASLLLASAIDAGLGVAGAKRLLGYPDAARVGAQRPPRGFVPFSERYLAGLFGFRSPAPAAGIATSKSIDPETRPKTTATRNRVVVQHEFTNDTFAQAYEVPALPFTARTNTRAARREADEPGACAPTGGTAWYRYVPRVTESLRADTFGTRYTVTLGVFRGSDLAHFTTVGCNSGAVGNAQVGFTARAGEPYFFQLTGTAGGGDLVFNLTPLGATELVSRTSTGVVGDGPSTEPKVSRDGRYVVFQSQSTSLDPEHGSDERCVPATFPVGATQCVQIFVRDRVSGVTELVSRSSAGVPGNTNSSEADISADGRFVVFESQASNLVAGDTNRIADVFVHDRLRRTTERVSVSSTGGQMRDLNSGLNFPSTAVEPTISADGRVVVFMTEAVGLDDARCTATYDDVVDKRPGTCGMQVYAHDRVRHSTELVSIGPDGRRAATYAAFPAISADGTKVAFNSPDELVAGSQRSCPADRAPCHQVYVRDIVSGTTRLASVSSGGDPANDTVGFGSISISADGNRVAFQTAADNLVPTDTNRSTDTFVIDLTTRTTTLASPATSVGAPESPSNQFFQPGSTTPNTRPATGLSSDGRFVVFDSEATNLVPNDSNGMRDVFVHDVVTGATVLVSVNSNGEPGGRASSAPAISTDGTAVVFHSASTNFADDDSNVAADVFLHLLPPSRA